MTFVTPPVLAFIRAPLFFTDPVITQAPMTLHWVNMSNKIGHLAEGAALSEEVSHTRKSVVEGIV
jgi:hypothetical protein